MCQEAARQTDPCVHGGVVATGSPDTMIGGKPAARLGDGHTCPAHVGGRITSASATVLINKVGAVRKLDTIACTVPPTPPPGGTPHKVAAHYKLNPDNEEDYEKALYADFKGEANTVGSGITKAGRFKMETGAGMVSLSKQGETKSGIGGRFKTDNMAARVTAEGGASAFGYGFKGDAKATMVSMEGSVYKGPPGDNGKNPYLEAGGAVDILSANAKADVLQGYDGKRIGVGGVVGAQAAVLSGEAKGRVGIPIPFTDWTIDIKGGVSGSAGSVGGAAGAMAFYDTEEKRFHLMGLLDIEAILGVGLNIDISIGKKFGSPPPPPAPAPDAVKMGCSTVFIGG